MASASEATLSSLFYLIGITAGLWLIHLFGRTLATPVLGALWLLLSVVIARGLFQRSRSRRRAFLHSYIDQDSRLQHWLRGGPLLAFSELVLGGALALALFIGLLRVSGEAIWLILAGAATFLLLFQALLQRLTLSHVSRNYLPELSWRWSTAFTGLLTLVILTLFALNQSYPDFRDVSLDRALWHMVDQEQARSEAALVLLQFAAAVEGLRLWLAQQLLPSPSASFLQYLAWMLVLAQQALFIWSFLLVYQGILYPGADRYKTGKEE